MKNAMNSMSQYQLNWCGNHELVKDCAHKIFLLLVAHWAK